MEPALVPVSRREILRAGFENVPAIISRAGERATWRFIEFFLANIRNKNTRAAYAQAVGQFFSWCENRGVRDLPQVRPVVIAGYIEQLQLTHSPPTVKQHLAAVRMLFDWLVVGQIVEVNPASSVRGPKYVVKRGKTPVLKADEARLLLDSIKIDSIVGLRDRALIGLMCYTFARVSAVVHMKTDDYFQKWENAGGFGCMKKVGSGTKFRRITTLKNISMRTWMRWASGMKRRLPSFGVSIGRKTLPRIRWRERMCCG